MRAGPDCGEVRICAGPTREGITGGVLANLQARFPAETFHEIARAQVGFRKHDSSHYRRWLR